MSVQLNQSHIDELNRLLNVNGDRAGFYLRYVELTGSQQALIQAHITPLTADSSAALRSWAMRLQSRATRISTAKQYGLR